jgi:hypothetical protein
VWILPLCPEHGHRDSFAPSQRSQWKQFAFAEIDPLYSHYLKYSSGKVVLSMLRLALLWGAVLIVFTQSGSASGCEEVSG